MATGGEEGDILVLAEEKAPEKKDGEATAQAKQPLSPASLARKNEKKKKKGKKIAAAVKKNQETLRLCRRKLDLLGQEEWDLEGLNDGEFEEAWERNEREKKRLEKHMHRLTKALEPYDAKIRESEELSRYARTGKCGRRFAEKAIVLGQEGRTTTYDGLDLRLADLLNAPLKLRKPFQIPDPAEVRSLVEKAVKDYNITEDPESVFQLSMGLCRKAIRSRRDQDIQDGWKETEEDDEWDERILAELEPDQDDEDENGRNESKNGSPQLSQDQGKEEGEKEKREDEELQKQLAANDEWRKSRLPAQAALFAALEARLEEEGDESDTEEIPARRAKEIAEGDDEEADESDSSGEELEGAEEDGWSREAMGEEGEEEGEEEEEFPLPPETISTSEDEEEVAARRKAKRSQGWRNGLPVDSDDSDVEEIGTVKAASSDEDEKAMIAAAALIDTAKRSIAADDATEIEQPPSKRPKESLQSTSLPTPHCPPPPHPIDEPITLD